MHTEMFLIGAGGHAKVVIDALYCNSQYNFKVWDDNHHLLGKPILQHRIHAPIDYTLLEGEGHVAIGCGSVRREISNRIEQLGLNLKTIIHPFSSISEASHFGAGVFVAAASVIAPDSKLGKGVIVNHGAVVDHDCCVGDYTHIAPNSTLGGGVTIGDECLIGAGATILPGVTIADGVKIGAGSVVVTDILKVGVTIKGVPAK